MGKWVKKSPDRVSSDRAGKKTGGYLLSLPLVASTIGVKGLTSEFGMESGVSPSR